MKICKAAALGAALMSTAVLQAQPVQPVDAPVAVAPSTVAPVVAVPRPSIENSVGLPANTEVWLSPNAEVNSKRVKQGEKFEMTVARDVMLGDYIVIPRGTKGYGQISYRTGKGAFGKSAKMEFDVVGIELNGRTIPVTGHYRIEGQGNTGATVGAVVAVGVFGAFVTGRSAVVAQGTEYKAFTTNMLPVALGSAPAVPGAPAAAAPAVLTAPVAPAAPAPAVIKTSSEQTPKT
ncbi:hypothetical protein [Flavisphingomonas formosensis]|uniref:hypothetical protein n=1 Tax=Flavisphingomonas formosensis TaxID=861534 RepID=UPI0012F8E1B3|nr:hypothetical protein [Sphingomonas formosensis]